MAGSGTQPLATRGERRAAEAAELAAKTAKAVDAGRKAEPTPKRGPAAAERGAASRRPVGETPTLQDKE